MTTWKECEGNTKIHISNVTLVMERYEIFLLSHHYYHTADGGIEWRRESQRKIFKRCPVSRQSWNVHSPLEAVDSVMRWLRLDFEIQRGDTKTARAVTHSFGIQSLINTFIQHNKFTDIDAFRVPTLFPFEFSCYSPRERKWKIGSKGMTRSLDRVSDLDSGSGLSHRVFVGFKNQNGHAVIHSQQTLELMADLHNGVLPLGFRQPNSDFVSWNSAKPSCSLVRE